MIYAPGLWSFQGDALSIASIAGQQRMPVLLTSKNQIPQETLEALKQMKPSQI